MLDLYDSVVKVLEITVKDLKAEASRLLEVICCFDFNLMLHIMKAVLSKSAVLSEALQHKYQNILNAMNLVVVSKCELQESRSKEGWKTIYKASTLR